MIDANLAEALQKSFKFASRGPDGSKLKEKHREAALRYMERAREKYHSPELQEWNAQIKITSRNADSLAALAMQFRTRQVH